ncbi:MAG: tRNA pseudouridine synthase A, partial [Rhodospirillales bacterium]
MSRFKLTIEYDGTKFVGWQRQINGLGVQQVLEEAVTAFCGETINAFAAGRTDTGVHALGQVAHIDIEKETDADTVRDALNYHMRPHRVVILKSESVSEDFHARFSAKERIYQYKIINRRSPLAVQVNRALWVSVLLDTDAMHEAAQVLVGKHDFTSF